MERLTYWCDNGHGDGKWFVAIDAEGGEDYGPHVDRLAAYEETGLEPEEVKYAYQKGWKGALDEIAYEEQAGTILVDNPLLAKYIELGPVDRLRELAQADREGRVVVFQPGYGVVSIYNPKDEDGLYTMKVTGVIKKEEYEAALRREQDG